LVVAVDHDGALDFPTQSVGAAAGAREIDRPLAPDAVTP
jgi:hypothetical protein